MDETDNRLDEERLAILEADHQAVMDCLGAMLRILEARRQLVLLYQRDDHGTDLEKTWRREESNALKAAQGDLADGILRARRHDKEVRDEYERARQRTGPRPITSVGGISEVFARDAALRLVRGDGPVGLSKPLEDAMRLVKESPEIARKVAVEVKKQFFGDGDRRADDELRLQIRQAEDLRALVRAEYLDVVGALMLEIPEAGGTLLAGGPTDGAGNEAKDPANDPLLAERDQLVLNALRNKKAIDSDHRMATADIAEKAAGKGADANAYKAVVAKLKRLGYVDTKGGRSGGCWLTRTGQQRAAKL